MNLVNRIWYWHKVTNETFIATLLNDKRLNKCHSICSQCPPFACTQARRRPRHSSIALSINDGLVHAEPNVHQTLLEFVNVVRPWLIHSLLDDAPYLVVDWVEVGTVWLPQIWCNKSRHPSSRSRTVSCARACAGALSCWKMKNSPDTSRIIGSRILNVNQILKQ